jgi:hypothetical protein
MSFNPAIIMMLHDAYLINLYKEEAFDDQTMRGSLAAPFTFPGFVRRGERSRKPILG